MITGFRSAFLSSSYFLQKNFLFLSGSNRAAPLSCVPPNDEEQNMSQFCFMASRDPVSSTDSLHLYRRAADLAVAGERVSLFLLQNGVLATQSLNDKALRQAYEKGVSIYADKFSLRERGIFANELDDFIEPLSIDEWLRRVISEDHPKLIWH